MSNAVDAFLADPRPPISAEEMERRRRVICKAEHESLLESGARHPETDHIVDAYIRGEIEVSDLIPRLRAFQANRRG